MAEKFPVPLWIAQLSQTHIFLCQFGDSNQSISLLLLRVTHLYFPPKTTAPGLEARGLRVRFGKTLPEELINGEKRLLLRLFLAARMRLDGQRRRHCVVAAVKQGSPRLNGENHFSNFSFSLIFDHRIVHPRVAAFHVSLQVGSGLPRQLV